MSRPTPTALKRRLPSYSELRPLMNFATPTLNFKQRRLAKAASVWDLRDIARRLTPKAPFDYVDGAAEAEISLHRARTAYRDVQFHPGVLRDVSDADLSTTVFGERWSMPVGLAPTGFTRMMHSEGEYAGSAAAADAGVAFCLSTMGTASIEDVAGHAPDGTNWFQLYLWRDRERSRELIQRAWDNGFKTLLVTVDTAIAGARLRDVHNGMTIPPQLTLKTVVDAAYRPEWWFNFLTHEPLSFASISRHSGTVASLVDTMFDPSLTFDDLDWIREAWPGNLMCKGLQTVEDARRCIDHGADGVIVSNHGGRQLDRAPVPLHLLPKVREALGDQVTIGLDTGIMSGADVLAAVAQGADFTLVGRAYMYGLMAGGTAGVARMLEIMRAEMTRTIRLLGVNRLDELGPEHVSLSTDVPATGTWV
ncbi:alpha-hydroxy acid oxidase [Corynebacterium pacaense]|uniref:alpha-hydroxy acid oxidase n=1 Tax=Corynebacterium pacaense TaxID=1816684 RepID=UPI0009B9C0F8|nr:alpha-hydroxy acid oxidase [Corynebacterium pacaense]